MNCYLHELRTVYALSDLLDFHIAIYEWDWLKREHKNERNRLNMKNLKSILVQEFDNIDFDQLIAKMMDAEKHSRNSVKNLFVCLIVANAIKRFCRWF